MFLFICVCVAFQSVLLAFKEDPDKSCQSDKVWMRIDKQLVFVQKESNSTKTIHHCPSFNMYFREFTGVHCEKERSSTNVCNMIFGIVEKLTRGNTSYSLEDFRCNFFLYFCVGEMLSMATKYSLTLKMCSLLESSLV